MIERESDCRITQTDTISCNDGFLFKHLFFGLMGKIVQKCVCLCRNSTLVCTIETMFLFFISNTLNELLPPLLHQKPPTRSAFYDDRHGTTRILKRVLSHEIFIGQLSHLIITMIEFSSSYKVSTTTNHHFLIH